MTVLDTAGLLLFIFYAVSFTKDPLAMLIPAADQPWVTRLWALILGIGAALFDAHLGGAAPWTGPAVYAAIKEGGAAAVGAIITYHIGNGDFVGVFDSAATSAAQQDTQPALLPSVPKNPPIFKDAVVVPPSSTPPALTPAQQAGLVDLGTVVGTPESPVVLQPVKS